MKRAPRHITALLSVTAIAVTGQVAVSASAGAAPADTSASKPVIVVLRDQLAATPANPTHIANRRSLATSAQDAVLGHIAGTKPTNVQHFSVGNAFTATMTEAQAAALAANPAVASVVPVVDATIPDQSTTSSAQAGAPSSGSAAAAADGPGAICPSDPAKPLVEPEALQSIHAISTASGPGADQLATGTGVKVAFLADNMNPNYADFVRPDGSKVFIDYRDFGGDGPSTTDSGAEAFGDASSIAAQGVVIHDLSKFVNEKHPLPAGCNIVVKGVAPGASLVGLNVFGSNATNSAVLQAIDWAVSVDHVDVINESLGLNQYPDASSRNLFQLFNDQAVAAGVTVTASTGDAGVTGTIGAPAADPQVISTGASTNNRLYAQTTYGAFPFSNGKWVNDNISALSSAGITQDGGTLDLTAPGEGNWADCDPGYAECRNFQTVPQPTDLESFGGTSESAPLTAATAALVIEAYRKTHGNSSPTPATVKTILTSTAQDMGLPADEQGAGLLNARAAVEAALTFPGAKNVPSKIGQNITVSRNQTTLEGAPGSSKSTSLTVTNVGTTAQTVATGARSFATTSQATQQVAFDATTLPTFVYYNGTNWAYKKVTFTVPRGTNRLLEQLAWPGGSTGTQQVVRLTLLAPDGTYVANSRPQGGAATPNYANVDVRQPAAGTWTAVLYSATNATGFKGNLLLSTTAQRTVPYGQVSPAVLTLQPGQSRNVRVTMTTPPSGGDAAYSVTFGSSGGHLTTSSVILRSLIPTASGTGHFSGTITGGNARAVSPAQTFSYEFDVAKGKRDLDVAVKLSDFHEVVSAVLVDPNGEAADVTSNLFRLADGKLYQGLNIQATDANPISGRWRLVVVVQNPVAGTSISHPFTGAVAFDKVKVSAALPTSAATKLAKGRAHKVNVRVTNTGSEPISLGIDPRTNTMQTLQAALNGGSGSLTLPAAGADQPVYVVPPDTTSLTVASSASLPAQVELQNAAAGLDLFGNLKQAQKGSTVSVATVSEKRGYVGKGVWFGSVQEIGPFGPDGASAGSAMVNGSLRTAGFDSAVTSSTDDPFAIAVDPAATGGTPVVIEPGTSATISVTITPNAKKGTRVSGHLNVVTPPGDAAGTTGLPQATTGEVIAVLPYSYTVG